MSESRKKILDVGCGSGMYVDEYRKAGHEAYGVDLCVIEDPEKPYLRKLDILGDEMKAFVKEVGLLDYVISLEVGEHLRPRDSQAYVDALCSASTDTIIFSAAHPGQGGSGHINCQPKEYWIKRFANNMFQVDNVKTSDFYSYLIKGYHMGWLKMNAIIFTRVKPNAFGDTNYSVIDHEELPQAQRIAKYL